MVIFTSNLAGCDTLLIKDHTLHLLLSLHMTYGFSEHY